MLTATIQAQTSVTASFQENQTPITASLQEIQTIVAGVSPSSLGGTLDHTKLRNRDAANQHTISSITNLSTELEKKLDGEGFLTNFEIQSILDS